MYNVLDARFPDEIQDSVCVGQRRPEDEDERVLLFLLMKPGVKFTEELVGKVKSAIAQDVGRRCVPKYVFETPEIPVSYGLSFCVVQAPLTCRFCRRLSTSRKWSFLSSKLFRVRSSSLRTRWPTRSVSSFIISLPKSKSWLAKMAVRPKQSSESTSCSWLRVDSSVGRAWSVGDMSRRYNHLRLKSCSAMDVKMRSDLGLETAS